MDNFAEPLTKLFERTLVALSQSTSNPGNLKLIFLLKKFKNCSNYFLLRSAESDLPNIGLNRESFLFAELPRFARVFRRQHQNLDGGILPAACRAKYRSARVRLRRPRSGLFLENMPHSESLGVKSRIELQARFKLVLRRF